MSHRLVLAVAVMDRVSSSCSGTQRRFVSMSMNNLQFPSPLHLAGNVFLTAQHSLFSFLKVWLLDKNFDEFYSKAEQ